jgi:hypothetical protein
MRTEYVDANNKQRHPALRDDTGQFFIPSDLDDARISTIVADTQVWKVEFYVGDSNTPEPPQYYHVPARPPTIAELRKATLPDLDEASKRKLQSLLIKDEPGVPGRTPLTGPTLTLTAINASTAYLTVQGVRAYPSPKGNFYFRDAVQDRPLKNEPGPPNPRDPMIKPIFWAAAVPSNTPTNIPCANWLNGDVHCASSDAYLDPAIGDVRMTGVELILPPTNFVEIARFLSVQQLLP